jgi:two-component system chemotaxis response regulator CheY
MTKFLIVDDSIFIRKILREILNKLGYDDIDDVSDGYEAVQAARKKDYDVFFMDIMMPKLNGIEAIRQIKPFCQNGKIIVCTSAGQSKIIQDSLVAGADDIIIKPFDTKNINEVLEKHIGRNKK